MPGGATRELPILISARNETAQAAGAAKETIRGLAAEANRANGAGGGGGGAGGAGGSFGQLSKESAKRIQDAMKESEESFREQAREVGKMAKLIKKGGGAFLAVTLLSHVIEGLAKGIDEYRENIKSGMAPIQAFSKSLADNLPVIGPLASAFHDLWTAIRHATSGLSAEEKVEAKKANDQQNRELREKMQDEKNRREGEVRKSADEGALSARDQLRLGGLDGPKREAEEARIRRDQQLREAAKIENSARTLGKTEDQDRVKGQAALMRQAAQQELVDKLNDIDRRGMDEAIKADMDSRERIQEQQHEGNQARLEEQGRFVDAKVDKIRQEYDKEIAEIQRREGELKKGAGPDDEKFKMAERIAKRDADAAAQRRDAQISQAQATDSEENKRQQQSDQQKRDRKLASEKTLHEATMDLYRSAAAQGDKGLEREAKKQEILDAQAEKLREIQAQMDKAGTTDTEKENLRRAAQTVRANSAVQMLELMHPKEQVRLSAFTESRGASGIGDLLRSRATSPQDTTLKEIKDILAALKQPQQFFASAWDSLITKYPQLKAVFDANGGGGDDFFRAPTT
jgi:hypothetical protein